MIHDSYELSLGEVFRVVFCASKQMTIQTASLLGLGYVLPQAHCSVEHDLRFLWVVHSSTSSSSSICSSNKFFIDKTPTGAKLQ